MDEIIIELHGITSAAGWYFDENRSGIPSLPDYEPVVCFALVSTHNSKYQTLAPTKRVIAIDTDSMDDVVGKSIVEKHTDLIHADAIRAESM